MELFLFVGLFCFLLVIGAVIKAANPVLFAVQSIIVLIAGAFVLFIVKIL